MICKQKSLSSGTKYSRANKQAINITFVAFLTFVCVAEASIFPIISLVVWLLFLWGCNAMFYYAMKYDKLIELMFIILVMIELLFFVK